MSPIVVAISLTFLSTALVALVVRMTIGPTVLDRAVAFDVLVSITIITLALEAAISRSSDTLPILLVLTLLGFVGSVSIARFINPRDVDDEEAPT